MHRMRDWPVCFQPVILRITLPGWCPRCLSPDRWPKNGSHRVRLLSLPTPSVHTLRFLYVTDGDYGSFFRVPALGTMVSKRLLSSSKTNPHSYFPYWEEELEAFDTCACVNAPHGLRVNHLILMSWLVGGGLDFAAFLLGSTTVVVDN